MNQNKFDDTINQFIEKNPKKSFQLLVIVLCSIWMSPVVVLGLILYLIASKIFKVQWWLVLAIGSIFALESILLSVYSDGVPLKPYLQYGFTVNKAFWKLIFTKTDFSPVIYLYHHAGSYLLGFPVLVAGILSTIDLIKDSPHKPVIDAIQKGEHYQEKKELSEKKINKAMQQLEHVEANGVLLGVSTFTAKPVVLPDHYVNQIVMVLGTTGSGKTVTLQRFYDRAIKQGHPLIVIDGKPTQDNISWLSNLANYYGKRFYGFNCYNYAHYDPLSNGDCSELKDKIISLKDHWESDYYRSIAVILQTTFEVLLQSGKPFDLKQVVKCLDFETLKDFCRSLKNSELLAQVDSLQKYEMRDITGLQAHLKILVNSAMGKYFEPGNNMFTLEEVIKDDALVYFSLPALRYPSFSKVLGKLVINDIKATIERHKNNQRIFMVFDEFSVFAGDQVLNLVNMGRGKGVHAVFGTQGIADLNTVSDNFKSQMLNCANTIICHRLNDQESAEAVAGWMGTKDTFNVTAQYDAKNTGASLGSVRSDKTYVIHPESIKQGLRTGEAYCVSKVGRFRWDKVKVMQN